ncbi:MAG: transposase [Alloprevotella sp.]
MNLNRQKHQSERVKLANTKPSMKRRSPWHDYYKKGTYLLTLVVETRESLFGELKGSVEPNSWGYDLPRVELSKLGTCIMDEEVRKIHQFYPMVEVWKVCVMPDHIHLIVNVNEDLPRHCPLGKIVAGFKFGCSQVYQRIYGMTANCKRKLFETGYNDKILLRSGQLEKWKRYLDDNPRRLLIKRKYPHLFTVIQGKEVAGKKCQIVGNRFLLDIPDKVAVIVHRHYSDEENALLFNKWFACVERGGVLVGTAIAPKEKEVFREAFNRGYRIILLRENGFPKIYKPSGESFDACAKGLLLQISPWEFHTEKRTITREQCLELNKMAELIANG